MIGAQIGLELISQVYIGLVGRRQDKQFTTENSGRMASSTTNEVGAIFITRNQTLIKRELKTQREVREIKQALVCTIDFQSYLVFLANHPRTLLLLSGCHSTWG